MKHKPAGLIAGKGELPAIFAREAVCAGREVVAVVFDQAAAELLAPIVSSVNLMGLGQAGKVISTFKKSGVTEITMLGKVDKRVLYKNPKFDLKALSIMRSLDLKNDDAVMNAITGALEKEGFTVVSQTEFLKHHMPGAGLLAGRAPLEAQRADITFGMKMARGIAAMDIGQTVVVKDGAVLAVEAIEGTDEAIERGARIAGEGAVVCKVAKPDQDERFDVPAVGVTTVETMGRFKASVLAVEAGKTLVVDMPAMEQVCSRYGISFVAV
ncbi:MAG: LpxI family protein [Nitrospinae bacterium]|nr:LpxI family protein [Nitrospinota bacterium]